MRRKLTVFLKISRGINASTRFSQTVLAEIKHLSINTYLSINTLLECTNFKPICPPYESNNVANFIILNVANFIILLDSLNKLLLL